MTTLPALSRVFDDLLTFPKLHDPVSIPNIEIRKDEDSYTVKAELPGYSDKEVDVKYEGGYLTVSGKRELKEEKNSKLIHSEFYTSNSFSRSVRFEIPVDVDRISAELKNGILSVTMPFAADAKGRKIEVKALTV